MKDSDYEPEVTPDLLMRAYAAGVFPMADSADSEEIFWVEPRQRGVLPLDRFHLSRSLRKRLLRGGYRITVDRAFEAVVDACADRPETWINGRIRSLYSALHARGHAHSVEVWIDDRLAGGLYGVRLGAAFFGESMFSSVTDGSKIALAHLVARLRAGRFRLLDTQFTTEHLSRLGTISVPRQIYHEMLDHAVTADADFYSIDVDVPPEAVVHLITHTS